MSVRHLLVSKPKPHTACGRSGRGDNPQLVTMTVKLKAVTCQLCMGTSVFRCRELLAKEAKKVCL